MAGIIKRKKHKALAVNGYLDHVHIFLALSTNETISDLVKSIKQSSTNYIKEKEFIKHKFNWQKGYGAFSYSKSQINSVINYIKKQEEHHKKKTFEDEYLEFLKKFGVDYDERYVLD